MNVVPLMNHGVVPLMNRAGLQHKSEYLHVGPNFPESFSQLLWFKLYSRGNFIFGTFWEIVSDTCPEALSDWRLVPSPFRRTGLSNETSPVEIGPTVWPPEPKTFKHIDRQTDRPTNRAGQLCPSDRPV